jgi:hypothetical protein
VGCKQAKIHHSALLLRPGVVALKIDDTRNPAVLHG